MTTRRGETKVPALRRGAAERCRNRRPAKDNRLSGLRTPILVGELGAIPGHDGNHGMRSLLGLRRDFDLLACCRGEANRQGKPVQYRGGNDSPSRCICESGDEVLRGHVCIRLCRRGHCGDLADWSCDCPRAIAAPVERLLLPHAPSPIARGFAGQLPERRREGGLGRIAKGGCDRHDRLISVPQHVHGLLETVLAQPGMR